VCRKRIKCVAQHGARIKPKLKLKVLAGALGSRETRQCSCELRVSLRAVVIRYSILSIGESCRIEVVHVNLGVVDKQLWR
jgi:hypothetical protein